MADITGTIPSNGELQGVISTASFIAGNVVGVIGPRGDKGDPGEKGDPGDTGATGNGISSAVLNSDYTLTLNFTDGTSYTTVPIRGEKGDTGDTGLKGDTGDTGNGISSVTKTGTQGLVDTYTITFTNGTTTTFTVTNGQNGTGSVSDVWVNGTSVLDGNTAKVIVPTKVSDLTNDSGFVEETDLADVATTGDYDDLINTPNVATVVELTQAQYDALTPAEKNNGNIYCVSDASGTYLTASEVSYGSSSVQDALDDLQTAVSFPEDKFISGVRYVKGYFVVSQFDTMLHRIQDFIDNILTDSNTICCFDVILNGAGQFRFTGYIYSGKQYGSGLAFGYGGWLQYWQRNGGTDVIRNLEVTS